MKKVVLTCDVCNREISMPGSVNELGSVRIEVHFQKPLDICPSPYSALDLCVHLCP